MGFSGPDVVSSKFFVNCYVTNGQMAGISDDLCITVTITITTNDAIFDCKQLYYHYYVITIQVDQECSYFLLPQQIIHH